MSRPRERGMFIALVVMSVIAAALVGTTLYYAHRPCPENPDFPTTTVIPSTSTSTTSTTSTTSSPTSENTSTTSSTEQSSTERYSSTSATEHEPTSDKEVDTPIDSSSTPSTEFPTTTVELSDSTMYWPTSTSKDFTETEIPSSKNKHKSSSPTVEEYTSEADMYDTTEGESLYVPNKSSGRTKGHKNNKKSSEPSSETVDNFSKESPVEEDHIGDEYDQNEEKHHRGKHMKGYSV